MAATMALVMLPLWGHGMVLAIAVMLRALRITSYMGPGYGPGVNGWGGGWNSGYNYNGRFGSPPAILPYMGGPSIYNVPGTTLNPLPSQ